MATTKKISLNKPHHDLHTSHKKHRNVLYSLVILLAIIQTSYFVVMSIQISELNVKIDSTIKKLQEADENLRDFTTDLVENYNSLYQENFREITFVLTKQQEDFEQEVKLLKSAQEDFSGVVKDAVKSVVTVATESSLGTGFIVDPEGYIVTNYHIIKEREDQVSVRTYDRKVFPAFFIGGDEVRDLALLQIPGEYDYLKLADSDRLQAGRKVIAIGNPLGLSFTVTEGIISAVDRIGPNGLAEYVQTDVSLNPGNSGGPLIDTQGEVVAINNFKIGGAESLGFALESNAIREGINRIANQTIIP